MLVHEGLGYNRFGLRYVGAEEIAERKKHVLGLDFSKLGKKIQTPQKIKLKMKRQKHLKKMEEERKEKVIRAQILSFSALAITDMSVGLFHLMNNNPSQAMGDILCAATAFTAAACFTIPTLKKQRD